MDSDTKKTMHKTLRARRMGHSTVFSVIIIYSFYHQTLQDFIMPIHGTNLCDTSNFILLRGAQRRKK